MNLCAFGQTLTESILSPGGVTMAIVYRCRHCKTQLAELDEYKVDIKALGWDRLSAADYQEMVQIDSGHIVCQVACEDCENALQRNPHYHELDYFMQ
ncbi:hypothetical protein CHI12_17435 [Terribacillus saccharophilus]|uniref:Peptide ABC transporter permease n=2 Tax=Terribacillus saccharophilus TaxID=361277 RepID=A0A268H8Q7_9BACI|nr:hypothetical protein CHI12_17435 [Terribacillus saccharophilus]